MEDEIDQLEVRKQAMDGEDLHRREGDCHGINEGFFIWFLLLPSGYD